MSPPRGSNGLGSWVMFLAIILGALMPICILLDKNVDKFYVFDNEELHQLAQRAVAAHGNDTKSIVEYIVTELQGTHAPYINPNSITHEEWMFNNAGGAMGAMTLIHASITEYLIIFGTPAGTEGHSGRHTADNYFNILTGTQLAYVPGKYEAEVYPPGSVHHLPRGDVKQYKMPGSCFALEYSRGWIPPMLLFGYADAFTSTLDFPTLWTTTYVTGREMIGNLLRFKL
ncbi:hypothetical protein ACJ41O_013197 [Fusarium nematophilum]